MDTKANVERADVYQAVTDRIIAAIEAGAGKWEMPWHVKASSGVPMNALTGKAYRGTNVVSLWAAAQLDGYEHPLWATYAQWSQLGAQVRKGEKSSIVAFWKAFEEKAGEEDSAGNEESGEGENDARCRRLWAKSYHVFNAAQVDGFALPVITERPAFERIEEAERFFAALGANIHHGGSRAAYSPSLDIIKMPEFAAFSDPLAYYSTLAHEATHWSGHTSRCARDLSGRFGSDSYAAEELVAELGAAFVCASLGLASEPRPDHAAYIDYWLKVLKSDKSAIFTAASHAQRAADWMHARQMQQAAQQAAA